MPYRRGYRRGYGRRRRYGRRSRRPNAGRAVPRTSFAPRHQYLKLKSAFQLVAPAQGVGVDTYYRIRLNNAYEPQQTFAPAGWTWNGDHAPLGWNAYGSLFQRYVVHGVKVTMMPQLELATTKEQFNINSTITWAVTTDGGTSQVDNNLRRMPISGLIQVTPGSNRVWKRYFNMNRIMGQPVVKYDRYYLDWGDTVAGEAFLTFDVNGDIRFTNFLWITMVWYISAVSSNARAGDPAAFSGIKAMTVPFTGGEQPDPVSADIREAINTGVARNKRALQAVNLGGDA